MKIPNLIKVFIAIVITLCCWKAFAFDAHNLTATESQKQSSYPST